MKYAFGKWNWHLKGMKTIDKRVYERLVEQFQRDIHNGRVLYQYELSLPHPGPGHRGAHRPLLPAHARPKRHVPMGTFDHLYIAMGSSSRTSTGERTWCCSRPTGGSPTSCESAAR